MFQVNEDNSIYATRGDTVYLSISAENNGEAYTFEPGEVLRIKIYGKKKCEDVVLQKDFPVTAATQRVDIILEEADTKLGEVISKPKDYWYEVELNPFDNPQTIIGYDENGAKVFKLFPEGADIGAYDVKFVGNDYIVLATEINQIYSVSDAGLTGAFSPSVVTWSLRCAVFGNMVVAGNYYTTSNPSLYFYKNNNGSWSEFTVDGVPAGRADCVAISNSGNKIFVYRYSGAEGQKAYTLSYDEANDKYVFDGYLTGVSLNADYYVYDIDAMFNGNGSVLAVARGVTGEKNYLTLIDMTTTPETRFFDVDTMPASQLSSVAYSPDGSKFAYIGMSEAVKIFDVR
ncbi:MAG: hypothetical protein J6C89_06020 [Clostridia bacterium]|nr:hypothetical protein [Clostridia bacterium]